MDQPFIRNPNRPYSPLAVILAVTPVYPVTNLISLLLLFIRTPRLACFPFPFILHKLAS